MAFCSIVCHVQGELFKLPNMNMCNLKPNSIHVYTFFSINNFHVPMNVD